ncbi:NAD(P)H-dependent flavin oxidoreductase [Ferrovibrio xuzhouensis]|uniref:Propionate 3-nitronate monooxygenase n=1 Tax=Ferrovibrio xuzhouensis TaxID=1576914 RepID=A0ABV7VCG3_9PROT
MPNALCRRLGIAHPVLLAPMAGEASKPALATAVSNAGGLGTLGCGYMTPQVVRDTIRAIRAASDKPFGINLFLPLNWTADPAKMAAYRGMLAAAHADLGIAEPDIPNKFEESFIEQFAVVLDEVPPVFSCTFGIPKPDEIAALKARNILVVGTATTVAEAKALEAAGVDAIAAQGAEAGGHRGSFLAPVEQSMIGTMALVPQIVSATGLPVIAAGGITDGRGVAAALCLGAQAAAVGTGFLLADEAGLNQAYRTALQGEGVHDTTLTRAFSGRSARGIRNAFLEKLAGSGDDIPDYPVANAMSRGMRAAAAKAGRAEYLSLWAGQAAGLARAAPAAEILQRIMAEARAALVQDL